MKLVVFYMLVFEFRRCEGGLCAGRCGVGTRNLLVGTRNLLGLYCLYEVFHFLVQQYRGVGGGEGASCP